MGAEANVETVKAIYQAFGSGDMDTILGALTDDIDWAAEAAGNDAPWWGQHHGKEAVQSFFAALGENAEVTEFTPLGFASNDTEVMVRLSFGSRNIATGKEAKMEIFHYWRFRDGKVDMYRGTEDTQQTAATFVP